MILVTIQDQSGVVYSRSGLHPVGISNQDKSSKLNDLRATELFNRNNSLTMFDVHPAASY